MAGSAEPSPSLASTAAMAAPVVPVVVGIAALVTYGTAGLARYLTYHSGAYDLGFFDQVVERTAQGHFFQSSFLPYPFLGQHWEPVLLLPAALDRILPTAVWLLLIQAAALAAAPLAAWRLARRWLGQGVAAPVAAVVTAINPLIATAATFDFHSEALTPALALLALDAAAARRRRAFVILCASLFLVKEDALLVAAGAGWIVWRVERDRVGLMVAAAAITTFGLLTAVIMPAIRGSYPGDLTARYSYMGGDSVTAILGGAIRYPGRWLSHLASASAGRGWMLALAPLAGLPLLSGIALVAVLPVLLIALLSGDPDQAGLRYHYGLEAFPLLLACALLGWQRLRRLDPADHRRRRRLLAGMAGVALAGCSAAAYWAVATLPGGRGFTAALWSGLERRPQVERLIREIPADAGVTASSGLVPHLSARPSIFEFPAGLGAPYVILDSAGPVSSQSHGAGFEQRRAKLGAEGYRVVDQGAGVALWAHR